jgi:hypothetical protein
MTITAAQAVLIELPTIKNPTYPIVLKVLRARRGLSANEVSDALQELRQAKLLKRGARQHNHRGRTNTRLYHITQDGLTARAHAVLAERRAS